MVHFHVLQISFSESKWIFLVGPDWEALVLPQAAVSMHTCVCELL